MTPLNASEATANTHTGRVAIITGSDRNLGKAMAAALLQAGGSVVLSALYGSNLEEVVAEFDAGDRVLALEGDISNADDREVLIKKSMENFGRVDILVNNAAITPETIWPDFMLEGEPSQWTLDADLYRKFLEIDTVAPHALMAAVVPQMIERRWGRIINISTSLATMLNYWPYGAAKAALEAQTAVLAKQLDGTGVTANILGPGAFAKPADIQLPDGRVVKAQVGPEIMEAPVRWLTSDQANGTNGKRIIAAQWKGTGEIGFPDEGAIRPIAWTGLE